jgi:hypothetical protein
VAIALQDATASLRRTPGILDAMLRGLPDAWVRRDAGPETWSSLDVVGHLVEAEETNWIPRIRHLLQHGETAAFPPFDRFGFEDRLKDRSPAEVLDVFAGARARSLAQLDALGLQAADLERRGQHPDFGPVTLGQLVSTWVVHDLNHLGQIVDLLARQHTAAVGPWRAFLGILDPA